MKKAISRLAVALAVGSALTFSGSALAHSHGSKNQNSVYDGYFNDDQVKARPLSDWEGEWQSVYPYLKSGALDPVMAHKAEHGGKTAAEYRAYYEKGYKTDVDRIDIQGDSVTFHRGKDAAKATYASDGHQILTYEKGNRGVRFIFKKTAGDEAAPKFIQFSDHNVAPVKAEHYHIFWGDDRAATLKELDNWPTYYPANLSAKEIVEELEAH